MSLAATIIIPTHNHGPLLRTSVASALRQTVRDIEVFVIGDGVDDDTRDIMRDLMQADQRVRFFDRPKGPRHGEIYRHEAIAEACGNIICYLSDDDLYLPNHVEVMRELLADSDFAHSMPVRVDTNGRVVAWTVDLTHPFYRQELLEGRNRIPLSAGAHTAGAYRRLPAGWSTTPAGTPTDLFMWQKFLRYPDCRFAAGTLPTVLVFPSPNRSHCTLDDRVSELKRWFDSMSAAELTARIFESKVREAAAAEARILRAERDGNCVQRDVFLQVFFPSPGGHNEAASKVVAVRTGCWQKLSIHVPYSDAGQPIRIDPAMEACLVEFADIQVRTLYGTLLWQLSADTAAQVTYMGTAHILRRGNVIRLFSDGIDPIVILPVLPINTEVVTLYLLLRVDLDVGRLRKC